MPSPGLTIEEAVKATQDIRKHVWNHDMTIAEVGEINPKVLRLREHLSRRSISLLDAIKTPDTSTTAWRNLLNAEKRPAKPIQAGKRGKNATQVTSKQMIKKALHRMATFDPETGILLDRSRMKDNSGTTVHVGAEGVVIETRPVPGAGYAQPVYTPVEEVPATPKRGRPSTNRTAVTKEKANLTDFERLTASLYKNQPTNTIDAIITTIPPAAILSRVLELLSAMESAGASQETSINELESKVNSLEAEVTRLTRERNDTQAVNNRLQGELLDARVALNAAQGNQTVSKGWLGKLVKG